MKKINNKHGPEVDDGIPVTVRPRDGTERLPRDGTERKPRDGTERMPRDGTERKPRDGTVRKPRDKTLRRRTPVWSKPAFGTGRGRCMSC